MDLYNIKQEVTNLKIGDVKMKTKAMTQSELANALGLVGGQATAVNFKDPIEILVCGKILPERTMKVISISIMEELSGKTYVDVYGFDTCLDTRRCIVWSELRASAKKAIQKELFKILGNEA